MPLRTKRKFQVSKKQVTANKTKEKNKTDVFRKLHSEQMRYQHFPNDYFIFERTNAFGDDYSIKTLCRERLRRRESTLNSTHTHTGGKK